MGELNRCVKCDNADTMLDVGPRGYRVLCLACGATVDLDDGMEHL